MTTVVLADDEVFCRARSPRSSLEGDIPVLAEAADGASAVTATLTHQPDVLVHRPRDARPGVLRSALKLGVQGFASKAAEPAHIASVIGALHAGRRWIDQGRLGRGDHRRLPLTDREIEVLRVTRDGYSVAEIAASPSRSPRCARPSASPAPVPEGGWTVEAMPPRPGAAR